jgi:small-conductance mechanosensitive channel
MIWLLLLIELIDETINGDKHDFNSFLRLLGMFLIANLWGLLMGSFVYGVFYVLARFAIFDISIALLRGHSWDYLGTTSKYDLFLKKFNRYLLLALRVVCILIVLYYEFIN